MPNGVKAALRVVLLANDVEIAESDDEGLWQSVFGAITTGAPLPHGHRQNEAPRTQGANRSAEGDGSPQQASRGLPTFAEELGLTPDEVVGACDPTNDPPYIHLNAHYWEALKRNTPQRGIGAVSPAKLAATLLALWTRHAKFGIPTSAHVQNVLDTIHLQDKNPGRAVQSCEWLQMKNGGIVLNPAETSRALSLAKAYCTKSTLTDGI